MSAWCGCQQRNVTTPTRERDLPRQVEKGCSLRQSPKQIVSKVVADFNLTNGWRGNRARQADQWPAIAGHAPYVTFLPARAGDADRAVCRYRRSFVRSRIMDKSLTVTTVARRRSPPISDCRRRCCSLKNAISKSAALDPAALFPDALDLLG